MSRRTAKLLVLAVLGLALSIVAYFVPVLDWIATAQAEIETFGAWSPVLYVVLYIILTLCLVPGSAMTFTAGLLYGLERGTMISLSAATIAAVAAFVTGRYLARERIAKLVARSPRFRALDRAVEKDAWKIVLLMRLSPAFPYVLLNYAFGMTRVSLPVFTLATLIGMIPATLFLTSAAAALGEAADGARRDAVRQQVERLVTAPDIVFSVRDLGTLPGSAAPFTSTRTDTEGWTNNAALNSFNGNRGLGGPGTIVPGIEISFTDLLPYWLNSDDGSTDADDTFGYSWGSFDGTTKPPVIYPIYADPRLPEFSLEYIQDVVLKRARN
ncbi:MAG: TVP38/TMEM64 family protein [Candidatus Brocadiae bacterium]|nr:TVP38/TMEM64 family protein [Candidatus Brocadiia bacterium]